MSISTDVLVIGVGGVGSAALAHLAKRGVRAIGIDRFPPGHDRGSSHGQTRIIRLAYFEHPSYVPLLRRAYQLWQTLSDTVGERLFDRIGLLEVGPPDGPTITGVLAAARQHGLHVETLTRSESHDRFPGFHIPDGSAVVFERDAGVLRVERCVVAYANQATSHGARMVIGESVRNWSTSNGSVEVVTDRNVYHAERLVVTAGPWAPELLASVGVPLVVRRKHLYWHPVDSRHQAENGCPAFFFETAVGEFYGIPAIAGWDLKVGEHTGGDEVKDPLTDPRPADPVGQARVETFLRDCLPAVTRPASSEKTCFYTMSPDGHFLVDRHPEHANVVFAAGLSGHGFKFTGVLGEALADLAIEGRTELPIDFLRLRSRTSC